MAPVERQLAGADLDGLSAKQSRPKTGLRYGVRSSPSMSKALAPDFVPTEATPKKIDAGPAGFRG